MDNDTTVRCLQCGNEIGKIITLIDGQERLYIGGLLVNVARGVCVHCGAEFHWSISEKMLAELVRKVIEMR
jgi:DNA-directed RNA polymerase subunit RPC12/RpoP